MPTLVFDIETVGEPFDALDHTTQEVLTRWIRKESSNDDEYEVALQEMKDGLGFSPLTGEIVAIGVMDVSTGDGAVYYQAPGGPTTETEDQGVKLRPMTEKDMLEQFWKLAMRYDTFVTFNGRGFDVPFLMVRSAIHGIRPSKDLMAGRYLYQQRAGSIHIDLLDQLSFYGAVRKKGNLHLWSRAFGIESPKSHGVTGDDVGALFKEKKFQDIARYNVRDLYATRELYEQWEQFFKF